MCDNVVCLFDVMFQCVTMLRTWMADDSRAGDGSTRAHELERALEDIGREDIVYSCMRNVQRVNNNNTDEMSEALLCIERGN